MSKKIKSKQLDAIPNNAELNRLISNSNVTIEEIQNAIASAGQAGGETPDLSSYATKTWVENKGYTTNNGTVTSVAINNTKYTPNTAGTVDLGTITASIPVATNTTIGGVKVFTQPNQERTYDLTTVSSILTNDNKLVVPISRTRHNFQIFNTYRSREIPTKKELLGYENLSLLEFTDAINIERPAYIEYSNQKPYEAKDEEAGILLWSFRKVLLNVASGSNVVLNDWFNYHSYIRNLTIILPPTNEITWDKYITFSVQPSEAYIYNSKIKLIDNSLSNTSKYNLIVNIICVKEPTYDGETIDDYGKYILKIEQQ